MKIEIPWHEDILLRDLVELLEPYTSEIIIDGDRKIIVAINPDEYVLEELENRGIKYRVLEEG